SRLGFFREGTHDVCDPRQSRQLLSETCDALDRLMAAARSLGADAVREVELAENVDATERVVHLETGRPLDRRAIAALTTVEGLTSGPYVTDRLKVAELTLTMRRHVRAFFQGNRYLLADLVSHVVDQVPRGAAVADLYAGAGLFGIAAAMSRDATVAAVEGDPFAADDLRENAAATDGRVTPAVGRIESFTPGQSSIDTAIVDPPRTGMSPEAI